MRNQKGAIQSTLVTTVSVLTLLALGAAIFIINKCQIDKRNLSIKSARDAAEYGMTLALKKIEEDPRWAAGLSNVPFRDCICEVRIEKSKDSVFTVVSTGSCNEVRKKVICTYRLSEQNGVLKPSIAQWEYP